MTSNVIWTPVFDALPHGIVWMRGDKVVRCNPAAEATLPGKLLGASPVDSIGYDILAIQRPTPKDSLIVFDAGTPRHRELRRRCDHWRRLALQDPLTKLDNRLSLERRLHDSPRLWAALVDCDDFGRVNKDHGHQTGDRVLAEIGRALLRELRQCDRIFRIGGDEFVILFGPSSSPGLGPIAERLLRAVRRLRVPTPDGGWISPTCTMGLGEVAAGASVEELLSACDAGLGAIKQSGKDGFSMSGQAH